MGWLIVAGLLLVGASALLSDLCLHHTAATSAYIRAILRWPDEDPRHDLAAAPTGRSRRGRGPDRPDLRRIGPLFAPPREKKAEAPVENSPCDQGIAT